ncbi:MAG: dTDP-4-dehydrorhamnose 3,5-epimerase [Denitrovibrio sp.]|nr:MAG: dTDP-4-dehydrorhamnose 3,5-epimerase [Denitrovibrio sp.]
MPFNFNHTEIYDVQIIEPKVFYDARGFFMETYKKSDFQKAGIDFNFVQDNFSQSTKGVLRGLHYQANPKAQGKLVKCVKGTIFDVAVDIRKDSKTFSKWVGYELSDQNNQMLWIPPGFAHGFLTMSDFAEIIYKVSGSEYSQQHEKSIIWNDPDININWPLIDVSLADKDALAPLLRDAEVL